MNSASALSWKEKNHLACRTFRVTQWNSFGFFSQASNTLWSYQPSLFLSLGLLIPLPLWPGGLWRAGGGQSGRSLSQLVATAAAPLNTTANLHVDFKVKLQQQLQVTHCVCVRAWAILSAWTLILPPHLYSHPHIHWLYHSCNWHAVKTPTHPEFLQGKRLHVRFLACFFSCFFFPSQLP